MSATRAMYSDIEVFCCNHSPPTPPRRRKPRLRSGKIPTIGGGCYPLVNASLCLELYGGETDECIRFAWPFGDGAGELEFRQGTPSPQADTILTDVLSEGLSYYASGLLQLAFPTPPAREGLIREVSEHSLWRFANGGDADGLGAGSWSCCLIEQTAVDAMRKLATPEHPGIGQLIRLHDILQNVATDIHARATRPAEAPGQKRKGSPDRQGDALQNVTLRVHVPTPHDTSAMSSVHHRDIYGAQ